MKVNVCFEDGSEHEKDVDMVCAPSTGDEFFIWGQGVPTVYVVSRVRHVIHQFGGETTSHSLEIEVCPRETN